MSPETVRAVVIDVLQEIQQVSGRSWSEQGSTSVPISTLDGFDSLSGVEATVMIEAKLGCRLDIETVFVSEDGRRALSIGEVVDRVVRASEGREETNGNGS